MQTFTKEQVPNAYATAPSAMREAFNSEKTIAIIAELQSQYVVRPEVISVLGKEFGYLLLGLTSPKDFYDRLVELGNDPEATKKMVEQVHEKIFVPANKNGQENKGNEVDENSSEKKIVDNPVTALPAVPVATTTPPVPLAPAPRPNTTPLVKQYAADPYRESTEEK